MGLISSLSIFSKTTRKKQAVAPEFLTYPHRLKAFI
jgi:hypothetical protein